MRRQIRRAALSVGLVTVITLAACGTTIDGRASVGTAPLDPSASSPSTASSSGSAEPPGTSTTSRTPDDPGLPTGIELPTGLEFPTDLALPTDLLPPAIPLPTDVELPSEFGGFSTELPAGWPSGIAFPEGTTIYGAVEDASGTTVVFESPVPLETFTAFFDSQLTGLGYAETENLGYSGAVTVSYSDGTTEVSVTATEVNGTTSGIVLLGPVA